MRFSKILNESERGRSLLLFDIDETTFRTFAMIRVMVDGEEIKRLDNKEFNSYTLKPGESFDFSEFRDADFFNKTSKPIQKILAKLKAILSHNAKVVFLTARADFDNKDVFLDTFRKYGMDPEKFYVERAGNLKKGSIPERKMYIILKKYLSTGLYRRAYMYDDFIPNCTDFLALKDKIPEETLNTIRKVNNITDPDETVITFQAYQVLEDGSVREVK